MTKIFRVFLSSSFQDMHAERDYLKYHAFAALQVELLSKGYELQVLDLRGTTVQPELAVEEAVMRLCLDGIEYCKPRMVALLGDRYGWVAYGEGAHYIDEDAYFRALISAQNINDAPHINISKDEIAGRSVTHLEIYYGLKQMPHQSLFFYDRTGLNYEKMDVDLKDIYCSQREKQLAMKAEIKQKMQGYERNLKSYKVEWDTTQSCVTGLEQLNTMVYADLKESFEQELSQKQEHETICLGSKALIESRARRSLVCNASHKIFIRKEIESYVKIILSRPGCYWLKGCHGSGVTTYTAQISFLIESILSREKDKKSVVVKFATEESGRADGVVLMLYEIAFQLLEVAEYYCEEREAQNLEDLFENVELAYLEYTQQNNDLSKRKKTEDAFLNMIYYLLDILEGSVDVYMILSDVGEFLEIDSCYASLPWFSNLPNFVTILFSSSEEDLTPCFNCEKLEIPEIMDKEPIRQILSTAASEQGKRIPDEILEAAGDKLLKGGYTSPLEITAFSEVIINMTAVDYMTFSGPDAYLKFMTFQIEQIGKVNIFYQYFNRLVDAHGRLAVNALNLMWVSLEAIPDVVFKTALSKLQHDVSDLDLLSLRGSLKLFLCQDLAWKLKHKGSLLVQLMSLGWIDSNSIYKAKKALLEAACDHFSPHPFILAKLLKLGQDLHDLDILVRYARHFETSHQAKEQLSRSFCEALDFGYFASAAEVLKDDLNAYFFLCVSCFHNSPKEAVITDDLEDEEEVLQRGYKFMTYEQCMNAFYETIQLIFDIDIIDFLSHEYWMALYSSYVFNEGTVDVKIEILTNIVTVALKIFESEKDEFFLINALSSQLYLSLLAKTNKSKFEYFEVARKMIDQLSEDAINQFVQTENPTWIFVMIQYCHMIKQSIEGCLSLEIRRLDRMIYAIEAVDNLSDYNESMMDALLTLYETRQKLENNKTDEQMLVVLEEKVKIGWKQYASEYTNVFFRLRFSMALYELACRYLSEKRTEEAEKTLQDYFDCMVNFGDNGLLEPTAFMDGCIFEAAVELAKMKIDKSSDKLEEELEYLNSISEWVLQGNEEVIYRSIMSQRIDHLRYFYTGDTKYLIKVSKDLIELVSIINGYDDFEDETANGYLKIALDNAIQLLCIVCSDWIDEDDMCEASNCYKKFEILARAYLSKFDSEQTYTYSLAKESVEWRLEWLHTLFSTSL